MLIKLLGLIDLSVVVMLLLVQFGFEANHVYAAVMLLHALKALAFIKDILSILDLAIVLYTLIFPFWSNATITIIVVIFLGYKGLLSVV